jgi:CHAT domain-containing protein/tetratricopeptide (TPR) repeat protein
MMNLSPRESIISTFFAALERRDFAACTAAVTDLQTLATDPADDNAAAWATYCSGILAFEADQDFARAAAIFTQLSATATDQPLRGRVLIALGRVQDVQGLWTAALTTYAAAVELFGELGEPIDQVRCWKNMAATYQKAFAQGDLGERALDQGRHYCELALAQLAGYPAESPALRWLENSLWNTLGTLYMSQGRWVETIAAYEHGLTLVRALDDRHAIAIYTMNLGEVYHIQGQYPAAVAAYQAALTLLETFRSPQIEMDLLANLGALYTDMGEFATALSYYDRALQWVEAVRQEISDATTRANFFATTVESYYAHALLCALAADDAARVFAYSEQARARQLRDQVDSGQGSELPATLPTLAAVQHALARDTVILSYFTTGVIEDPQSRFRPQISTIRHRFPAAKTVLLVITHTAVQLLDLDLSPNLLYPHGQNGISERYFLEPILRRHLYQMLLAPVAATITPQQQIVLIPHGPLHQAPFQALAADLPDSPFAQLAAVLQYAPSVALLMRRNAAARLTAPPQGLRPALALGYNGREGDALHFAEAETQRVAELTSGMALTGASPKKAQIADLAEASAILHLSCHGHFDRAAPHQSTLHLGPTERLTVSEVLLHAPAGLGYRLVVLSACESGLNQIKRGDELLGFARAFLQAGARTVLATLWRVDERATYLLMEHFYQALGQGAPHAIALRRAQRYLQTLTLAACPLPLQPPAPPHAARSPQDTPYSDPFYWAAFVLLTQGDGHQACSGAPITQ